MTIWQEGDAPNKWLAHRNLCDCCATGNMCSRGIYLQRETAAMVGRRAYAEAAMMPRRPRAEGT